MDIIYVLCGRYRGKQGSRKLHLFPHTKGSIIYLGLHDIAKVQENMSFCVEHCLFHNSTKPEFQRDEEKGQLGMVVDVCNANTLSQFLSQLHHVSSGVQLWVFVCLFLVLCFCFCFFVFFLARIPHSRASFFPVFLPSGELRFMALPVPALPVSSPSPYPSV